MHQRFETEYTSLYTRLISASERPGVNPHSEVRAHVLSAAIEGAVHDAARRGTLRSPALKQELVRLVDAYLTTLEDA